MSTWEDYKPYVEALMRWREENARHSAVLTRYLTTVKELGVKHEQTMAVWHELLDSIDMHLASSQELAIAESATARSQS
jgi:hypothetical protein